MHDDAKYMQMMILKINVKYINNCDSEMFILKFQNATILFCFYGYKR